jgi:hypothetical protein
MKLATQQVRTPNLKLLCITPRLSPRTTPDSRVFEILISSSWTRNPLNGEHQRT